MRRASSQNIVLSHISRASALNPAEESGRQLLPAVEQAGRHRGGKIPINQRDEVTMKKHCK